MPSENLFCYTITNYSQSKAGAITGVRSGNTVDANAAKDKATFSNGDVACFNFKNNSNASKLVFRQYNYSGSLIANQIISSQGIWASPDATATWNGVKNLHAVAYKGQYLYATGYDLAKVVVVNMLGSPVYQQIQANDFPSVLAQSGHTYHGEGLAEIRDHLYVLFSDNIGTGYDTYDDGYVVQYQINSNGTLVYTGRYVRVGKNGFTLEKVGNNLYVCALGGKQHDGSTNADTCISIVTIGRTHTMSVNNARIPTGVVGDFRDISIVNGFAYIFSGYYNQYYADFNAYIYRTPLSNLTTYPTDAWTLLKNVTDEGYFWAINAEGYQNKRFWFVKGNVIEVYGDASGSALGTAANEFEASDLTDSNYTNINAACFIMADGRADEALARGEAVVVKSCVGAARLAREARELAEKKKEEK